MWYMETNWIVKLTKKKNEELRENIEKANRRKLFRMPYNRIIDSHNTYVCILLLRLIRFQAIFRVKYYWTTDTWVSITCAFVCVCMPINPPVSINGKKLFGKCKIFAGFIQSESEEKQTTGKKKGETEKDVCTPYIYVFIVYAYQIETINDYFG